MYTGAAVLGWDAGSISCCTAGKGVAMSSGPLERNVAVWDRSAHLAWRLLLMQTCAVERLKEAAVQ